MKILLKGLPKAKSYLRADEVPVEIRDAYDFGSQRIDQISGRGSMTIERKCQKCYNVSRTRVTTIRTSIRAGTLNGLCHPCSLKLATEQPKGEAFPTWKGGKFVTQKGYVYLRCPEHPNTRNGYVFEHRVVMENSLGRYLLPFETVHHKNGIKTDNRVENLELWSKNHSDGQRYDDMTDAQIEELIGFLRDVLKTRQTWKKPH